MSIEILYYDECPTYRAAEETVRGVLAEQGIETTVELVAVNTDDEARQARFPGSPTIRVAGRDFFPVAERDDWRLGCRVYATPEGLRGSPPAEMFREALPRAADLSWGCSWVLDLGYAGFSEHPSSRTLGANSGAPAPQVVLRTRLLVASCANVPCYEPRSAHERDKASRLLGGLPLAALRRRTRRPPGPRHLRAPPKGRSYGRRSQGAR